MVLFKIDMESIATLELKSHTPRSVDMDGVARRAEALQRVEVVTGMVHVGDPGGRIEPIKSDENALVEFGVYLAGFPG